MGCEIKRIVQLNIAITSTPIKVYDNFNVDVTKSCMFSWSTDCACWSTWTTYDNYIRITPRIENDFYLRILISGGLSKILLNDCMMTDYSISVDNTSAFLTNFCDSQNLFQPYNNLDCALQLQEQLSDSIVCMFGIPIYYFRCEPKRDTADYTFKEYVLHNVTDVKQIKLLIKDGAMPSSNPKLTEFDFDWETDWETELSKTQFATAFGDNAIPKHGDFLYVPLMNRMWDVNSAYDEKNTGLLWRSTTWKLQLVKYADSTAYDKSVFDDIIDSLIPQTYENTFGIYEELEQEIVSQSAQLTAPMFAATNLFDIFMEDAIRKQYTKNDISIIDKQYNHRNNVITRNIYKFRNENGCITYQKGLCGDDGTLIFILETPGSFFGVLERDIMQFGNLRINLKWDDNKFELKCNSDIKTELEAFKSYMCIVRWNRANFITSLDVYAYTHRTDLPIYNLQPSMYWFDFENPICSITSDYDSNLSSCNELPCQIHSYPVQMTNIKYYNEYLDDKESLKEAIKYTTDHKGCVFNDLARPINSGHGYAVK